MMDWNFGLHYAKQKRNQHKEGTMKAYYKL